MATLTDRLQVAIAAAVETQREAIDGGPLFSLQVEVKVKPDGEIRVVHVHPSFEFVAPRARPTAVASS